MEHRCSKMADWRKVPIRNDLYDTAENIVQNRPDLGYSNVSRFVEDAVRRRVEQIYHDQGNSF